MQSVGPVNECASIQQGGLLATTWGVEGEV